MNIAEDYVSSEVAIKEDAEYYFPGLKESDDESIRKFLYDFINNIPTEEWNKDKPNEDFRITVLDWLEKQGKQLNKVSIWKHWKDSIAGNSDDVPTYLIKNGSTYSLSSCLGYECDYIELSELNKLLLSEKQGEQKPTDKVEQEDVELTDFESALFSAFSDAWQEYLRGEEVNVAKWAKEHSAELLEVAREQKPAWSEIDFSILDSIICVVEKWENNQSEEEKEYYGASTKSDWLKSLKERYSWKPSDEQIIALQESIGIVGVLTPRAEYLQEVVEHLKKLREE